MPPRLTQFVTGQIYHVFNRTIDKRAFFEDSALADLMLDLLFYYRSSKTKLSYSRFKLLDKNRQSKILKQLSIKKYFKVDILSYCLMPTHFHLLLKQKVNGGISKYISDVLNALTRYYNTKYDRKGPIFLPRFKDKHIKSREQLIHTSRYQHLNPSSSGLIMIEELENYPWSSYPSYIAETKNKLCDTDLILAEFGNDREAYKNFVLNHAEHQKTLEQIKRTLKW